MKPAGPIGLVNHLRHEASFLPAPMQEGVWIRRGGVRFQVVAGHDEHGAPALAWEAMPEPGEGTGLFFHATLAPAK